MIDAGHDRTKMSPDLFGTKHYTHEMDNTCLKLFIASFDMRVEFDAPADTSGLWQSVFYLKELNTIEKDEITLTLVCIAKSLFRFLYKEAECVGNNAISFRVTYPNNQPSDIELSQLFTLSVDDNEDACPKILDDRAISHCTASIWQGSTGSTIAFVFNDPQVEQIEKIMVLLSTIFPPPIPIKVESWLDYLIPEFLKY